MKNLIHRELAERLWLILFLFNMLVSAYSRHVGWMLFWVIALGSYAYKYGYKHGKTEERLSGRSACRSDFSQLINAHSK